MESARRGEREKKTVSPPGGGSACALTLPSGDGPPAANGRSCPQMGHVMCPVGRGGGGGEGRRGERESGTDLGVCCKMERMKSEERGPPSSRSLARLSPIAPSASFRAHLRRTHTDRAPHAHPRSRARPARPAQAKQPPACPPLLIAPRERRSNADAPACGARRRRLHLRRLARPAHAPGRRRRRLRPARLPGRAPPVGADQPERGVDEPGRKERVLWPEGRRSRPRLVDPPPAPVRAPSHALPSFPDRTPLPTPPPTPP